MHANRAYRSLLVAVLAVTAVAACVSRAPQSAAPPEVRADAIRKALPLLRRADAHLPSTDASVEFSAYADSDRLVFIVRRTEADDGARSTEEYLVERNAVVFYERRARQPALDPERGTDATVLTLAFDASGKLASASKTVNGALASVEADEVEATRRQFKVLLPAAEAALAKR